MLLGDENKWGSCWKSVKKTFSVWMYTFMNVLMENVLKFIKFSITKLQRKSVVAILLRSAKKFNGILTKRFDGYREMKLGLITRFLWIWQFNPQSRRVSKNKCYRRKKRDEKTMFINVIRSLLWRNLFLTFAVAQKKTKQQNKKNKLNIYCWYSDSIRRNSKLGHSKKK